MHSLCLCFACTMDYDITPHLGVYAVHQHRQMTLQRSITHGGSHTSAQWQHPLKLDADDRATSQLRVA